MTTGGPLPIKRTPITTFTLRAHIHRMTFFNLDFYRGNKFCFAFFAFIEVYHFTIKERFRLKKPFLK
jgi:hypothetical protein